MGSLSYRAYVVDLSLPTARRDLARLCIGACTARFMGFISIVHNVIDTIRTVVIQNLDDCKSEEKGCCVL